MIYERGQFLRNLIGFLATATFFGLALSGLARAQCTPGGLFKPTPTTDCTMAKASPWLFVAIFSIIVLTGLVIMWVVAAAQGVTIVRCSRPLYPLLDLLVSSAEVVRPATRYTQAIELSQKVSRLGLPLRNLARNAAADFGNRRALRSDLIKHLGRVDAVFIDMANGLAGEREAAAHRLGELAAQACNNIAAGRFTAILPADVLPEEVPLEPDQLDGRRLGTACLWAAAIVTSSFLILSPLGAPVELLVPLAMVAFIVMVYAILAFRHGLSEATRLTRSIGGFFSASPPV
ncbi:hypothetical protein [Streptomyces sp. NPDC006335]|uniref:hypothetical protein n=1 Tax=Streptomyces sp. NPDC006335 TaxID=3156895 RepID=UPI0033B3A7FC